MMETPSNCHTVGDIAKYKINDGIESIAVSQPSTGTLAVGEITEISRSTAGSMKMSQILPSTHGDKGSVVASDFHGPVDFQGLQCNVIGGPKAAELGLGQLEKRSEEKGPWKRSPQRTNQEGPHSVLPRPIANEASVPGTVSYATLPNGENTLVSGIYRGPANIDDMVQVIESGPDSTREGHRFYEGGNLGQVDTTLMYNNEHAGASSSGLVFKGVREYNVGNLNTVITNTDNWDSNFFDSD